MKLIPFILTIFLAFASASTAWANSSRTSGYSTEDSSKQTIYHSDERYDDDDHKRDRDRDHDDDHDSDKDRDHDSDY